MQCLQVLLTWPQNDLHPKAVRDAIVAHSPVKYLLVARERHEDGHFHLHCVCVFGRRVEVTTNWMVRMGGKVGNARLIKSTADDLAHCLSYVVKECGESWFEWDEFGALPASYRNHPGVPQFLREACGQEGRFSLGGGGGDEVVQRRPGPPARADGFPVVRRQKEKKVAKTDALVDALKAGVSDRELLDGDLRGAFLLHGRRCAEVRSIFALSSAVSVLEPWRPIPVFLGEDANVIALANWLNGNCDPLVPRALRQEQLWLWGPTRIGKSSLIVWLKKFHIVYDLSTDEDYLDDFGESHSLISVDESFSLKLTTLNHMIDGTDFRMKQKGRQFLKRKNVPVIFTSNLSPAQAFPNASRDNTEAFKAFLARLTVIHIETVFFPEPLLHLWR